MKKVIKTAKQIKKPLDIGDLYFNAATKISDGIEILGARG